MLPRYMLFIWLGVLVIQTSLALMNSHIISPKLYAVIVLAVAGYYMYIYFKKLNHRI